MKYEQGILTEADIKARRRFWNKGVFSESPKGKSWNGVPSKCKNCWQL